MSPLANERDRGDPISSATPSRTPRWSRCGSFPVRRPGLLNDGKRLHAIGPGGKTRPDDIVLDETRPTAAEPQEDRHEWKDREIDRREFAGQIVAGRGLLPYGELTSQAVQRFPGAIARRETSACVGEILIGLTHHAPLDGALARITGEKGRPRWPALLDIFDNRRRFGEHEIVIDQDWHAAARVEGPQFGRLQVAGVERQRLAMIGNSLVFKREPDPPRIGRA